MKKHDYKVHSMVIEYRNIIGELVKELDQSVILKQSGADGLFIIIPKEGYSIIARDRDEAEKIANALELAKELKKGKKK